MRLSIWVCSYLSSTDTSTRIVSLNHPPPPPSQRAWSLVCSRKHSSTGGVTSYPNQLQARGASFVNAPYITCSITHINHINVEQNLHMSQGSHSFFLNMTLYLNDLCRHQSSLGMCWGNYSTRCLVNTEQNLRGISAPWGLDAKENYSRWGPDSCKISLIICLFFVFFFF